MRSHILRGKTRNKPIAFTNGLEFMLKLPLTLDRTQFLGMDLTIIGRM